MRKRIVPATPRESPAPEDEWLDVERLARVEITSEDPAHPIEAALLSGGGSGWRAAHPGAQTLRLLFDAPQRLRRICVHFVELATERRQEFVLRWSPDGTTFRDIIRQQWNFTPEGATTELEDYQVELAGVLALELSIIPDVSGGNARASLTRLRIA